MVQNDESLRAHCTNEREGSQKRDEKLRRDVI